jgi:uncharacterized protein YndB with AHSA1/START domain
MTAADMILEIDRVLPARPETVFRALTDPTLFSQWMGPEGSVVTVDELQLTLGGRLAFRVKLSEDGPEFALFGFYEEIEPPGRLVHSWGMEGDDEISTVVWQLEAVETGTRVQLRHHGLSSPEDVSQNEGGWNHQLDRLAALLTA